MKTCLFKTYALLSLAFATLFLVSSCSKINEFDEYADGTQMSIYAETQASKTVNSGMSTKWASGDELTAINIRVGGSGSHHVTKCTYVSGTEFTGDFKNLGDYNDWYIVYPYDENNKKADAITISVDATPKQTGVNSKAHLCGKNFPLFGVKTDVPKGDELKITMDNALAVAQFNVTNSLNESIIVTGIEFTSVEDIAGNFKVNLKDGSWTPSNGSSTISLSVDGDATIAAGATGSFYAGVAPHDIPAGSNVIVNIKAKRVGKDVVSCYISKITTEDRSFTSGAIKDVNVSYDENHPVPSGSKGYKLITSEPSDWSGKYVLVSADKKLVFTGSNSTSNSYTLQSGDLEDGVIVKDCSSYEFTISKDGSKYYLNHGGNYLYCNYSSPGDGTTGMAYSSSKQALNLDIKSDGTFGFWMEEGGVNQHIYYKSDGYFKFGGSHKDHCVYLYKYDDGGTPVPPTPTVKAYVKVTSAPTNWNGTYLFVDENSSKAFDVSSTSSASPYAVSVTIKDGQIEANETVNKYALTVTATGKTHVNVGEPAYSVQNASGKYIYYSSGEINIADSDTKYNSSVKKDVVYNHCLAYEDGGVQVLSSGNSDGFTKYYLAYGSSAFNYSKTESHKIQLYKLNETGTKQSQTLTFDKSSVEWQIGSTYEIGGTYDMPQTVKGAKTSVTYSSSDDKVATISGNQITIVGAGTTTITANAVETSSYYSASASYSLTIEESSKVYYTKMTSIDFGKKAYDKCILVYDNGNGTGYAFLGIYDGDASKAPKGDTDGNDNKCYLTEKGNAVAVTITSNGIAQSTDIDKCQVQLDFSDSANPTKGGLKMTGNVPNGWFRINNEQKFVVQSSVGYRMTFSISNTSGNNVSAYRSINSTNTYFSFDTNNNVFKASTDSKKFSIYMMSDK